MSASRCRQIGREPKPAPAVTFDPALLHPPRQPTAQAFPSPWDACVAPRAARVIKPTTVRALPAAPTTGDAWGLMLECLLCGRVVTPEPAQPGPRTKFSAMDAADEIERQAQRAAEAAHRKPQEEKPRRRRRRRR